MIYVTSLVKCVDTTGLYFVRCIKVLNGKQFGVIGTTIVGVTKYAKQKGSFRIGSIVQGLIVRTKHPYRRQIGQLVSFSENSMIVVDKHKNPLATRILGPVLIEFREQEQIKLMSISLYLI